MRRFGTSIHALVCVALSLFASLGSACKPVMHHVSDYVAHRIPDHVVFLGTVVSVEETQVGEGTSTQNIEFLATRWFGGKAQETVSVRGVIGSYRGTDCEGLVDFSAKKGEEWLMFGQRYEGKVNPDRFLSRKIVNGAIPASLLKELKQKAPQSR